MVGVTGRQNQDLQTHQNIPCAGCRREPLLLPLGRKDRLSIEPREPRNPKPAEVDRP